MVPFGIHFVRYSTTWIHYILVIVINETRSCQLDARAKGFIVWALWTVSIWKGLLINITSAKIALIMTALMRSWWGFLTSRLRPYRAHCTRLSPQFSRVAILSSGTTVINKPLNSIVFNNITGNDYKTTQIQTCPLQSSSNLSNIRKIWLEGWWIVVTIVLFWLPAKLFKVFTRLSAVLESSPDVGSCNGTLKLKRCKGTCCYSYCT